MSFCCLLDGLVSVEILNAKHPTRLILALLTMELLLRAKCFQHAAIPSSVRALHKDYRTVTPQNFSNYESMKQDFKLEIPEYFNFAKDVLDQWTNMEKVWNKAQSNHPRSDFAPRGHLAMSGGNFVEMT